MNEETRKTDWQRTVDGMLEQHSTRLSSVEQGQAVYRALSEERRIHLDDRFTQLQKSLVDQKVDLTVEMNTVKSNQVWATRLIIAAIGGGLVNLIVQLVQAKS